ncbi:MAG: hypothetical protein E2O92_09790 [Alphaproteobacteria bacterium]|nr:MAG: hypothetical protein E2O92_09790 [Alphaproteobacteria bacterium]
MRRTLFISALLLVACATNAYSKDYSKDYSHYYSAAHLAEVAKVASNRLSSRTRKVTQLPYEGVHLIWLDVEDLTARAFREQKVIALPAFCLEQPGPRTDRDCANMLLHEMMHILGADERAVRRAIR